MNEELKIGDVVHIPSGGPEMTIAEIKETGELICHRFNKDFTLLTETKLEREVVVVYRSESAPVISVNDVVSTYAKGSPSLFVVAINDPMIECEWYDKNKVRQSASFRKEELDKKDDKNTTGQFLQSNYMPYK